VETFGVAGRKRTELLSERVKAKGHIRETAKKRRRRAEKRKICKQIMKISKPNERKGKKCYKRAPADEEFFPRPSARMKKNKSSRKRYGESKAKEERFIGRGEKEGGFGKGYDRKNMRRLVLRGGEKIRN